MALKRCEANLLHGECGRPIYTADAKYCYYCEKLDKKLTTPANPYIIWVDGRLVSSYSSTIYSETVRPLRGNLRSKISGRHR
jgi:hypothetical protein